MGGAPAGELSASQVFLGLQGRWPERSCCCQRLLLLIKPAQHSRELASGPSRSSMMNWSLIVAMVQQVGLRMRFPWVGIMAQSATGERAGATHPFTLRGASTPPASAYTLTRSLTHSFIDVY